ncbi:hypothetical protein NMG60_11031670 [Bertholletia excelsa]
MPTFARFLRFPPSNVPQVLATKHQFLHPHVRALHLFDKTTLGGLYSLNAHLASSARNDPLAAWVLFTQMHHQGYDVNAYTLTAVFAACSCLPNSVRGRQVHALTIKLGLDSGTVMKTSLIDMYSKYGQLDNSVRVFDEMSFRDVVAWNAMLSSFLRHGEPDKALGVLGAMRKERVELSEFTFCSVLKACAAVKAFRQGKQVHALVVVMGRDLVVLSTALIDFYSSNGYINEAIKVHRTLNSKNDDVMLNSLISGCVRNKKYEIAMSLLSNMKPNIIALTSALAACSENSDLWIGKQVHGVATRQGFISDTQLSNVLLDMYGKCGRISTAHQVFDQMSQKDVVSWTSMIDAYGSHGRGHEALKLFKKMGAEKGNGVLPNSVTYLAVLSACGHSGLVEQGRKCFVSFRQEHSVKLGPEHYACFIDILGRAGEIEEAWCFFDNMVKNGVEATGAVWAALLNACRLNRDVERGELAAKRLFDLEPYKPANYVALSNFYAATGKWESVGMLRRTVKDRGIAKEAGSSWVSILDKDLD